MTNKDACPKCGKPKVKKSKLCMDCAVKAREPSGNLVRKADVIQRVLEYNESQASVARAWHVSRSYINQVIMKEIARRWAIVQEDMKMKEGETQ